MLMLPVFFSCEEPLNPDDPNNSETPVTPSDPDNPPVTPPEPQIEFRKTFKFGNSIFSTSADGAFVAVLDKAFTKSADERKIVTGTYTFDNSSKTWSFSGQGKIELLDDKKIAYTPANGTRTVYDNIEVTEIVSDESSNANKLNGVWTITYTTLDLPERSVNRNYQGSLDLNKVEKDARDLGIEFKYHMDDNMVVDKIIITDSMLAASFKNGQSYAAEHNLRLGSSFKLHEFTNDLDGTATVQFDEDSCIIEILTKLDQTDAKIRLIIKKA